MHFSLSERESQLLLPHFTHYCSGTLYIKSLEAFSTCKKIISIEISDLGILSHIPYPGKIQIVKLCGSKASEEQEKLLSKCTNIESLSISQNINLVHLPKEKLKSFTIKSFRNQKIVLEPNFFANCKSLKYLEITSGTHYLDSGKVQMANLSLLPYPEKLKYLAVDKIQSEALKRLIGLEYLRLKLPKQMGQEPHELMQCLTNLPSLKTLYLVSSTSFLDLMRSCEGCPSVELLALEEGIKLREGSAKEIRKKFPKLKKLQLREENERFFNREEQNSLIDRGITIECVKKSIF